VLLSLASSAVLFARHEPLPIGGDHASHMSAHLRGMWVAFGVAAAFIVYFLMRVRRALARREEELVASRHLAARQERLASLATMAAGAAHELSTPLGTVALAAKELERALTKAADSELAADARLIREQVGRCRAILEQMAQGAGTVGETVGAVTVGALLDEALVGVRAAPTVHLDVSGDVGKSSLRIPPRAVSQALRSLITNAQDASPPNATVVVVVRREGSILSISIRDRGGGIPAEVLARIGEPFFTTKAPGRGMGLGLFLARAVIEGVGGTLQIDSSAGAGTEVSVRLPTDVSPVMVVGTVRSGESPGPQVVSKPA
jgi:two-component system sensor histidine kinase RegB